VAVPQEFLRDVLRTGDTTNHRQRHWSILPLSIAAHAVVVAVAVIAPLAAEVELPSISSPMQFASVIRTVPPPAPPPRDPHRVVRPTVSAPLEAPPTIAEERPHESFSRGPVPEGTIDVGTDSSVLIGVGTSVGPPVAPAPPTAPQPRLVRAGQGVRQPKKIAHVAPEYPDIARQVRVDGTVILEAILDVTGRVQSVRVLRSVPLLDQAAIRAVEQWRYTPTELNGVPVPVLMTITVQFSLR
jgi:periplasmic protein TonB